MAQTKIVRQGPVVTGMLGCEVLAFSFRTNLTDPPDRIRDGSGALVSEVERTGAGEYTVHFNGPMPRQLVACSVQLADAAGEVTLYDVHYIADSFTITAGEATLLLEVVFDDGSPALADPPDLSEVHFVGFFLPAGLNGLVQD